MGQAVFFCLTSDSDWNMFTECTAHQGALAKTSNVATSFGTSDHQPWATETRPDAGSRGQIAELCGLLKGLRSLVIGREISGFIR